MVQQRYGVIENRDGKKGHLWNLVDVRDIIGGHCPPSIVTFLDK